MIYVQNYVLAEGEHLSEVRRNPYTAKLQRLMPSSSWEDQQGILKRLEVYNFFRINRI